MALTKELSDFKLSDLDWELLEGLLAVLAVSLRHLYTTRLL